MADGVLKPSCLFGAIEVLEKANEFYVNQGQRPYYTIGLAGVNLQQRLLDVSFSLQGVQPISAVGKTDVII
ncbi:MAG: helix-turn-helix protein [Mucilaginibacter sp.]|nr:helix-turn-helix protein [Mucilaginibacter sp.]